MDIRCAKCGHTAPWKDWPKGRVPGVGEYVRHCINPECDTWQWWDEKSRRLMPNQGTLFLDEAPSDPLAATLHRAQGS